MRTPTLDDMLALVEGDTDRRVGMRFVDATADYFSATRDGTGPVSTRLTPAEIASRFSEAIPLDGHSIDEVVARIERDILADGNRLMHPMALGHQVSAPLPATVWTEMVTAALNNSAAVWEMSPTGTSVEHQVIGWMCALAGFGAKSGGTLTSGGTEATFTAMLAARAAVMPDAWERGMEGPLPVMLCGEHAHYAATRAAAEVGIGMQNVLAVPSRDWKMDPAALAQRLDTLKSEGRSVLAVIATSGCTATGAFDDLEAIGAICEARGVWLHVDAAHGGSALLSERHGHRMRGVQRARTVAWDPHKMMLLPLSAGVVLARDERDLTGAFAQHAPYLFHGSATERSIDQGTRSFACSRRVDAIKVWVALQRYGARGIGLLYDHLCALASTLYRMVGERPEFEAMHEPEGNILCFRWVGGADASGDATGDANGDRLDAFNRALRDRYNRSGRGWITGTMLGGVRVLRVTVMNPRTREKHLEELLGGLADEAALMIRDGGW
jgi:L-2,4-diaminobutyrate decarboxylase